MDIAKRPVCHARVGFICVREGDANLDTEISDRVSLRFHTIGRSGPSIRGKRGSCQRLSASSSSIKTRIRSGSGGYLTRDSWVSDGVPGIY